MDIDILIDSAMFLQPYLQILTSKAVEKIGGEVPGAITKIWKVIHEKFSKKPAAKEALQDLIQNSDDDNVKGAFRNQLKKALREDAEFANQLQSLLDNARPYIQANLQDSVQAIDNSIAIGPKGVYVGEGVDGDVLGAGSVKTEYHIRLAKQHGISPAVLRANYLNRVFNVCGQLSLAGVDRKVASDVKTQLNLGAVYTGLLTRTPEIKNRPSSKREPRYLSAVEMLNQQPRLVLLGDPGSGKSTFVNFVALCLAGEALKGARKNKKISTSNLYDTDLKTLTLPLPFKSGSQNKELPPQPWEHGALLPIRIILRDFAARGLPEPGQAATARHLWDFIVADLDATTLGEYKGHMLNEIRDIGGLILLDGLDEVPEANERRVQIKQSIEDFAKSLPNCRILITSRTYAYQKQDWRLNGFAETELAPFTEDQIMYFIERWYIHIASLRNWDTEDAEERGNLLKHAIINNGRLRDLAERPLLLTLMSSLHAWRGGSLPEKREQLYADTVDLLLDWWESQRIIHGPRGKAILQPSLVEWLKIERDKVRNLLNKLAYQAHANTADLVGTADIPEQELVSGLMNMTNNPDAKPGRLVEYLSQRAGLLIPRGVGIYTFPHRSFQEYLAACYLTVHDYPDYVAQLARQDPNRWREVALLAGAKAGDGSPYALWALVECLCPGVPLEVPTANLEDSWGAHLAGQMLVDNNAIDSLSEPNKTKLERVLRWLLHILNTGNLPAIERAVVGETLARLGDPRFDPKRGYLPADRMMGFVYVPAGTFKLGSSDRDQSASDIEKPLHEMTLQDYWIGRYTVTVGQFQAFCQESGRKPLKLSSISNQPVTKVAWDDVINYCSWLTQKLSILAQKNLSRKDVKVLQSGGNGANPYKHFWEGLAEGKLIVTIPSEAEWEKAARGPISRKDKPYTHLAYPWGNNPNTDLTNAGSHVGRVTAVGCYPKGKSYYGCLDMAGNVWEWTRSIWGKNWQQPDFMYPYTDRMSDREDMRASNSFRVLRGGSFKDALYDVRCAIRSTLPAIRYENFGFRLVVRPPLVE